MSYYKHQPSSLELLYLTPPLTAPFVAKMCLQQPQSLVAASPQLFANNCVKHTCREIQLPRLRAMQQ